MTFTQRILPAPLLTVGLLLLWLMLSRSYGVGQFAIGLVVAVAVPALTSSLRPARVPFRGPLRLVGYVLAVLRDMIVASFQVAYGVVTWRTRPTNARFVIVPLDLREPHGLSVLAMVTTIVPGTVWSEIALDRSAMMLHVWDVDDESQFVAHYKARYEAPLKEIFE